MKAKLEEAQSALLDLRDPDHAYLFGFIQADGHLRRIKGNKGSVTIELGARDRFILEKFVDLFPVYSSITMRTRNTNFKEAYESVQWAVYDLDFRQQLITFGVPEGHKSRIVATPTSEFSERDYYRGWVDADGALGLTANGFPFVSFTTNSEMIARSYIEFIETIIGKHKTSSRNARDKVFNIAVYKEDAQHLSATLYYEGCFALPRKIEKARQVASWIRPDTMKKIDGRKKWTVNEDDFVVSHTIRKSMEVLGRSEKSVNIRRWRLRNGLVNHGNRDKGDKEL